MRRFAADNPSMLSCMIRRSGSTAWKPRSALLEGFLLALWPGSIRIRSAGGICGFPGLVYLRRYLRGERRGCRLPPPLNGGLSRLHCADEDAVSWLTSYGSWHAYKKKKKSGLIDFMWGCFNTGWNMFMVIPRCAVCQFSPMYASTAELWMSDWELIGRVY